VDFDGATIPRPRRKTPVSLNTLLSWVMVSLALLVSCTCASIFLATSQLRHVAATIDDAVQSVHSAEQAALELLIFDRASTTPIDRQAAERRLRERLSDARRYVSSLTEAGAAGSDERGRRLPRDLVPNAARSARTAPSGRLAAAISRLDTSTGSPDERLDAPGHHIAVGLGTG
jgi:hypothetical protein